MYFENILLNLLLMIGIIFVCFLLNFYLNRNARFLMKYTSSLKLNSKDLINKFSLDENINITSYPSRGNNDLDNYIDSNQSIFINARHYYSTSLYTLARTLYFCGISKIAKNNNNKYRFQNRIDSILTLLDVMAWGLGFIGLLLKNNILIIICLFMLTISLIFTFLNKNTIKLYYQEAINYLDKILKNQKEIELIRIIYRFESIQYLFKPFLAVVKLFPFLLSINQKKIGNKYEE